MDSIPSIIDDAAKKEALRLYNKFQGRISRLDYMVGIKPDGSYVFLYWPHLTDSSDMKNKSETWFFHPEAGQIQIPEGHTSAYKAPHLISPDVAEDRVGEIRNRHLSPWKNVKFTNELVTLSSQSLSLLYQESSP